MMRTTVDLDDALLVQLKKLAAETGQSVTHVIEDCVRETLARRRDRPRARVELPVFHGSGVQPGIDLNDSVDLLDRMEERDGAA